MHPGFKSSPQEDRNSRRYRDLLQEINWFTVILTSGIPSIAFMAGLLWIPLKAQTAIFSTVFAVLSSISVTGGYHRLWSHRSYSAHSILRTFFAIFGASAGLYSILRWCTDHRAHHRYLDSDLDPYSARKGLFHAHYGWLIYKRKPGSTGHVDIQDLYEDKIVMWQYKYYSLLLFLTAYAFPSLFCGLLFDDICGGIVYAACLRLFLVQQSAFCINSLAHWIGDKPFSGHTPCDSLLVAFITFGEGYHNFHHEFPMDYRNGIRWLDYDPTKWFIRFCAYANLAFDLKVFPGNEIEKTRFQRSETELDHRRRMICWGMLPHELPVITATQYTEYLKNGRSLVLIDDIVHDVSEFMNDHPGGPTQLKIHMGIDCTKLFHGKIYAHSNAAINLLSTMRFARIEPTRYEDLGKSCDRG